MAQNRFKISALVVAASWLAGGPALAESAMQQLQGVQQQSDQAHELLLLRSLAAGEESSDLDVLDVTT